MQEKHIAAIDLGSSKFAITVARISGDDIQIVYYKEFPSDGIRNSSVYNPLRAGKNLRSAIQDAEQELNIKIFQVCVGLPRYPVTQEMANGSFERTQPNSCISEDEIDMLKSLALETYPLSDPDHDELYGAVAQSFSTDEIFQLVEQDVVGTISKKLEGNFKIFIGKQSAVNSIEVVFNQLNIAIARMYFLPDAIAKAVLTQEEMEGGVALVDLGGGVTSVSIYQGNIMRFYGAIPFGGKVITTDIKSECSISEPLAENIKKAFGSCMPSKLQNLSEKTLQIRYDDRPDIEMRVSYLAEIIGERTKEIVDAVLYLIQESGFADKIRNGIVLTGGGANLMGISYLFGERSGYNVKLGFPRPLFSADGCYGIYETSATAAMGMILAAKNDRLPDCVDMPEFDPMRLRDRGIEVLEPAERERVEDPMIIDQLPSEEEVSVETEPETTEPVPEEMPQEEVPQEEASQPWDTDFARGKQGQLIEEQEFGEPVKKEERRNERKGFGFSRRQKDNAPKQPSQITLIWDKVASKFGEIYDNVTK